MVGGDIGVGEGVLAPRAHVAELEAGARVGGKAAERREVGDDRIGAVHQLLINPADGEAEGMPVIEPGDGKVTWRHRDQSRRPRQLALSLEDFGSVGQEHFRSREIDPGAHHTTS